jgi:hypothetical protein
VLKLLQTSTKQQSRMCIGLSLSCHNCGQPVAGPSPLCVTCRMAAFRCALCHTPVRGTRPPPPHRLALRWCALTQAMGGSVVMFRIVQFLLGVRPRRAYAPHAAVVREAGLLSVWLRLPLSLPHALASLRLRVWALFVLSLRIPISLLTPPPPLVPRVYKPSSSFPTNPPTTMLQARVERRVREVGTITRASCRLLEVECAGEFNKWKEKSISFTTPGGLY